MIRKGAVVGAAVTCGLLLCGCSGLWHAVSPPARKPGKPRYPIHTPDYPERVILTWDGDPTSSQAVNWHTRRNTGTPMAEIALADASPHFAKYAVCHAARTQTAEGVEDGGFFHSVTFAGLEPDTLYAYRVGNGEVWSAWFHFRTASTEAEQFTFIYLGDLQNKVLSLCSRTVRAAFAAAPDARFIVHAGDLVNRGAQQEYWVEWFEAGGWIYATVPSIATPGNHECLRRNDTWYLSSLWRSHFSFPDHGPKGLEETVYYTDYQGVRIISLDSMRGPDRQADWLEDVLRDNPNRWTLVTCHFPMYTTKRGTVNTALARAWKPLFDRYGVDMVLQGHDHAYGRCHDCPLGNHQRDGGTGPVYVVSVGGAKMYRAALATPQFDRMAENTQLYQIIRIDGDRLDYRAMTVTGDLYDAFCLVKSTDGSPNRLIEDPRPRMPRRTFENTLTDPQRPYVRPQRTPSSPGAQPCWSTAGRPTRTTPNWETNRRTGMIWKRICCRDSVASRWACRILAGTVLLRVFGSIAAAAGDTSPERMAALTRAFAEVVEAQRELLARTDGVDKSVRNDAVRTVAGVRLEVRKLKLNHRACRGKIRQVIGESGDAKALQEKLVHSTNLTKTKGVVKVDALASDKELATALKPRGVDPARFQTAAINMRQAHAGVEQAAALLGEGNAAGALEAAERGVQALAATDVALTGIIETAANGTRCGDLARQQRALADRAEAVGAALAEALRERGVPAEFIDLTGLAKTMRRTAGGRLAAQNTWRAALAQRPLLEALENKAKALRALPAEGATKQEALVNEQEHPGRTYVIDQKHPRASDENPGTADEPFRTIAPAASKAQPGDTVLVHAGTYRERVAPARGGRKGKPIIYMAAPGEEVYLKGSDVWEPQWQRVEGKGNVYRAKPDPDMFKVRNAPEDARAVFNPYKLRYLGRKELTRGKVFVDGKRMVEKPAVDQVAGAPDSWAYDAETESVHLHLAKGRPSERLVELSVRERIFAPYWKGLGHVHVKGFTMEHAANNFPGGFYSKRATSAQSGALGCRSGHHWVVENNTIRWAKGLGVDFGTEGTQDLDGLNQPQQMTAGDHLFRGNVISDNGCGGMAGIRSMRTRITGNVFERNNYLTARGPEIGAIKTHFFVGGQIEGNLFRDNNCFGIWLDNVYAHARVTRNVFLSNRATAIFCEMGGGPVLIDNNVIAFSNSGYHQGGIYSHDAGGIIAVHNLFFRNARYTVRAHRVSGRRHCVYATVPDRWESASFGRRPCWAANIRILNNLCLENQFGGLDIPIRNMADSNVYTAPPQGAMRIPAWGETAGKGSPVGYFEAELETDGTLAFIGKVEGPGSSAKKYDPATLLKVFETDLEKDFVAEDKRAVPVPDEKGRLPLFLWHWQFLGMDRLSLEGGVTDVRLDPRTLKLSMTVSEEVLRMRCKPVERVGADFFGRPLRNGHPLPGPFQDLKAGRNEFILWPIRHSAAVDPRRENTE